MGRKLTRVRFPGKRIFCGPIRRFGESLDITILDTFTGSCLTLGGGRRLGKFSVFRNLSTAKLQSVQCTLRVPRVLRIATGSLSPSTIRLVQGGIRGGVPGDRSDGPGISVARKSTGSILRHLSRGSFVFSTVSLSPCNSTTPFVSSTIRGVSGKNVLYIAYASLTILYTDRTRAYFTGCKNIPLGNSIYRRTMEASMF